MINFKSATLVDDYSFVWSEDPALDTEKDGFRGEYEAALESNDLARLPVKGNEKPTVFWLQHPSGELGAYVRDAIGSVVNNSDHNWQMRLVAQYSLVKVDDPGGFEIEHGTDLKKGLRIVTPGVMKKLDAVGSSLLREMGEYVINRMLASPN